MAAQGAKILFSVSRPKFNRFIQFRKMSQTAGEKLVVTEHIGNVCLIGINRPEKRNCVNLETADQLLKAVKDFEADDNLRVGVLHGKGGTFCAGYDLSELSKKQDNQSAEEVQFKMPNFEAGEGFMGPSRMPFSKPLIAAVAGHAVAGGLELSLMCDMRVAEESAVFGVFCRRFGVPLIDGGTVRLPHLIGLSRALDLILTGRSVGGREAYEMGLANRLVPHGAALGEAVKLAHNIAKFPQQCMLADRRSAYHAMYDSPSMKEALTYEWQNGQEIIAKESIKGAGDFVSGIGRGGSFDLNKKSKL